MNCEQARLLIGAQPLTGSAELAAHLEGCAACRTFLEETRALDGAIRRALEQPPAGAPGVRRAAPWRHWALAASVVLALLAGLALWLLRPSDTLARAVAAHVEDEPQSWLTKHEVDARGIAAALRDAGVALDLTSERISYAQSCWFRGHYVPHLVVQTQRGPATVIILPYEQVATRRPFQEGGMTGVIVPAQHGSIAVLQRGSGRLDNLLALVQQEVQWRPDTP